MFKGGNDISSGGKSVKYYWLIIIPLLLSSSIFAGCCTRSYAKGQIFVEFEDEIKNYTQANETLNKYNLSIINVENNLYNSDSMEVKVKVPPGKEKYYVDLLEKDPIIKRAELYYNGC